MSLVLASESQEHATVMARCDPLKFQNMGMTKVKEGAPAQALSQAIASPRHACQEIKADSQQYVSADDSDLGTYNLDDR